MIMLDAAIQGTLLGGSGEGTTAFTPTPYAVYANQDWHSHMVVAANLYDTSGDKITLAHESTDNGVTYAVTNVDDSFGTTTTVNRISRFAEIDLSGNAIIGYTSGIWVYWKDGVADWQAQSLSSIPGGSIGGGSLTSVSFDDTNNLFIVNKNEGQDINTTADFVSWSNPAGGADNPIALTHSLDAFAIQYIGGQYLAFGVGAISGDAEIWSSSDLNVWVQESPTLDATAFGAGDAEKEGFIVAGMDTNVSWFNSRFIIYNKTQVTDATDRTAHIFSSTNGLTWTEDETFAADATSGQEGRNVFVTSTAIEIVTRTHVIRSTNGTTWATSLLDTNVNRTSTPVSSLHPMQAKGHRIRPSTSEAPDHIAVMNVDTLQLGGKILHLTEVNATPTLGYPAGAATGADISFFQDNFNIDQIVDQGDTVKDSTAQSFFARSSGDRYFEATINATGGSSNKIGLAMLGTTNYAGSDETYVRLAQNLVEVSSGGDTVVVYTMTIGQVLGFRFDFTAATIEILVDNVSLHTESAVENGLPWVIECEVPNGNVALNVGQDAFVYTVGGTVAWDS